MKQMTCCCLTVLILFLVTVLHGQNLCPNPGFEQLSGCPSGFGELNLAAPWTDAGAPADLFSFCHVNGGAPGCNDVGVPVNFAGTSAAHAGSAYAGFYTKKSTANQRSYAQAPLVSTLLSGQLYRISAFFKRSSNSQYATNSLGISFSTGTLSQTAGQHIPVSPQAELTTVVADTSNWTGLTAFYTGTGLEDHITIGNFRSDAATTAFNFAVPVPGCNSMSGAAFYYVDDISVTVVNEILSVTGDTTICTGESTSLTGITNTTGWWSLQSTPNDTIPALNNVITVTPSGTTTYLWHGIQSTYIVTVSVAAPPVVNLPADTTVCEDELVLLDATNTGATYLWSNGETTAQVFVSDSGVYVVTVNNSYCIARDTFMLGVISSPDVNLGSIATVCSDNNETITLDAGSGLGYFWSPGGDTTSSIVVIEPGTYSVVVTHTGGCTRSDSIVISEVCRETIFIPGAFTPNGDGKNDLFYADGTNILSYKIIIFNRWGQPVFSSSSLGIGGAWNGKYEDAASQAGLYSYLLDYEVFKAEGKSKHVRRNGYFILFR